MSVLNGLYSIIRQLWSISVSNEGYIKYLRRHGITVGDNVLFRNPAHTVIDFTRPDLIEFGNNLDINDYFTVLTHDFGTFVFRECFNDFVNSSGKVIIGNNIVFGYNVTILKGVTIGDNCIIGAGTVITRDIPANSVVVGAPARVICTIEDYYKKRKSEQVKEALEYAKVLIDKRGKERVSIEDFTEEWVLFLTEGAYLSNPIVRHNVDIRLKGFIDSHDFFSREKIFKSFDDYINAACNYNNLTNE